MKKVVFTFGSIAGGILVAMMFITLPLFKNGTIGSVNGEVIGYTSMIIALGSMVFVGTKSYRDNHLHGTITFGKALQVGVLITLVASFFYAAGWEVYLHSFVPDFMEQYAGKTIAKVKASGASAAEIQQVVDRMDSTREMYKNPFLRFGMTLMEILPVGLLIALISAAIVKRKEVLPA